MMMRRCLILSLLVLAIVGCRNDQHTPTEVSTESEAAFIDSFLKSVFETHVSDNGTLVIRETMTIGLILMGENYRKFSKRFSNRAEAHDAKLGEAVRNYCEKNKSNSNLRSIYRLSIKNVILSNEEIDKILDTPENITSDDWSSFYDLYPKSPGLTTLSRPGFSSDGTIAVISMFNQSNWSSGYGMVYLFKKVHGKWVDSKKSLAHMWGV